jgi:hypothetical protein
MIGARKAIISAEENWMFVAPVFTVIADDKGIVLVPTFILLIPVFGCEFQMFYSAALVVPFFCCRLSGSYHEMFDF